MAARVLTNEGLRSLLVGAGIRSDRVHLADQTYAVLDTRWVFDVLYPWFRSDRAAKGLGVYSRRNDCDDFSRALAQAASDCHASTPVDEAEAPAFGEFWYARDTGSGHAINILLDPATLALQFLEPQQGGRFMSLSATEVRSCVFARF